MPGLLEYNPASHLIWWVAGAMFAALGVIVVLELWYALKELSERRHRGAGAAAEAEEGDGGDRFMVKEPDSELRHRHHRRVEAYRRTWHEGRPNPPRERG